MNEIIQTKSMLVNLTGPYSLDCTSKIISILSNHSVDILDIGQAVIHNSLNLSVLVKVDAELVMALMLKDMILGASDLGLQVRFNIVKDDQDINHLTVAAENKYILTLLSKRLESKYLALISETLREQGLEILRINRLSKKHTIQENDMSQRVCIELILEGKPKNIIQIHAAIIETLKNYDLDIAFQQDTPFRRNRRLVCFDMDSTLIEGEVIDELAKEAGVGDKVSEITKKAMQGELNFDESFEARVGLLKGLSERCLQQVADRLVFTEGAERLVKTLKVLGYKTAILSGGFSFFGRHVQERLGIDYMYANELDVCDGRVSGNIVKPIVNGERKASFLKQLAESLNIHTQQVIAVGDGANDLPMLDLAGLGIAFRAKPIVKAKAQHAISHLGLDGILYLMGVTDEESQRLVAVSQ